MAFCLHMRKFRIATLGCRTNQYESQAIADQLQAAGLRRAADGEGAELCVVNTCTVTQGADAASRQQVRQLARENPGAQVVVTGCLAERSAEELLQMEEGVRIVPNQNKEKLVSLLFPEQELPEFAIQTMEGHTRAFVKVQDGCNSFCTYCIIPYVRGRSRSRSMPEIVEEVQTLIANGYQEVVLTGINIGDFDGAPLPGMAPVRLAELVRAVDRLDGLRRLRLSSIDPDEVDEELVDAVLGGRCSCPSMHIVLQSGSNAVLKRMNRKYTRQQFLQTIERLKGACPEFTFTTDVIVGFPAETESDFEETLDVMRQVQFAKVHMFPYSVRARTRAALYPNRVAEEVVRERKSRLLRLAEQLAFSLRSRYVGTAAQVLIESAAAHRSGYFFGHTANFLPVFVAAEGLVPNQMMDVQLSENGAEGLVANAL